MKQLFKLFCFAAINTFIFYDNNEHRHTDIRQCFLSFSYIIQLFKMQTLIKTEQKSYALPTHMAFTPYARIH